MESIVERLGGVDFPRLRVGVGGPPEGTELEDFVLEPLDGEIRLAFRAIIGRAAEAVRMICEDGLESAMNRVNPAPQED